MSRIVRVAAVQAAPVLLDGEATLARVAEWTRRAAGEGARIVAFPETFVPGYPAWIDYCPDAVLWGRPAGKEVFARLVENSVEVAGPEGARLAGIARDHGVTLVVGVHERAGRTLFNSLLFYAPDGTLVLRHRKLMPTFTERLLWGQGDGSSLRAAEMPAGGGTPGVAAGGGTGPRAGTVRVGGLICWEHWMPLTRQALHDTGEEIHVAAWPAVNELHAIASRHYAFEGRCFVIAVGQLLRAGDLPKDLPALPEIAAKPARLLLRGGSMIIAPNGRILAGPVDDEETLVIADCDLREIGRESMTLDVSGHYSRPDVFDFRVRLAAGEPPEPAHPKPRPRRPARPGRPKPPRRPRR